MTWGGGDMASRRWRLPALLAALTVLCSGCSLDVESLLQPPKAQGEQQPILDALETYIRDSGKTASRYTLQYPSEGDYTSAFVVCDAHGMPTDKSNGIPVFAVGFYSFASSPDDIHINLLRRDQRDWVSLDDRTGFGANILQVAFGDLDGDGMAELLTGWDTYNSRDHRLAVLSMNNSLSVLSDSGQYTQLYVGDLTADEQEDVLLLRISGTGGVTATLETVRNGVLSVCGTVSLDGHIQQFGNMTISRLTPDVSGVYVDALKTDGSMVTELIYYNGTGLHAPFYDAWTDSTPMTTRLCALNCRDVDGDTQVEIPTMQLLDGYPEQQNNPSTAWRTVWKAWDYRSGKWAERLHSIVNTADGYLVMLDDAQSVVTDYSASEQILTVRDSQSGDLYMSICAASEPPPEYTVLYESEFGRSGCAVRLGESMDVEQAQYRVIRLDD